MTDAEYVIRGTRRAVLTAAKELHDIRNAVLAIADALGAALPMTDNVSDALRTLADSERHP